MYGSYQDIIDLLDDLSMPNPQKASPNRLDTRPPIEDVLKEVLYVAANKPCIKALRRELARQKRYGGRFAVADIEVKELLNRDHWRQPLSHAEFENQLRAAMRDGEEFFAYQSGHFFLFLLDVNARQARKAIDRIQGKLGDKYHMQYGLGVFPEQGQRMDDLILEAWKDLIYNSNHQIQKESDLVLNHV